MANIGSWDPKDKTGNREYDITRADLEPFLALDDQQLNCLNDVLSQENIKANQNLMTLHKNAWGSVVKQLEDEQIIALIRFFTLAEGQLPGWEAGSKSPVIWLCRELKKRGLFPNQNLIQWIKTHTDNRFLPYGNPLDFQ